MGQEWAASTPFLYFTDLEPDLGRLVTEGRRREFGDFPAFADAAGRESIPDPQAPSTFEASRLRWEECERQAHGGTLALYRSLLKLRREERALGASDQTAGEAWATDDRSIVVRRREGPAAFWIAVRLKGPGEVRLPAEAEGSRLAVQLTTEEPLFALDPQPPEVRGRSIRFTRPGAVILKSG
jgi:maltooligosyltrehalose trehalohydrolase